MTDSEKIAMVQSLVDNDPDATSDNVKVYLSLSKEKMLMRLYPFNDMQTVLPEKYYITQCELAARLFLRKGGEGEISHNENGVSRAYGSVDDEDILSRLTPYAGVM